MCYKPLGDTSLKASMLRVAFSLESSLGTADLMDCSLIATTCSSSSHSINLYFHLELKHQMKIFINKCTVSVGWVLKKQ